jgi:hypothetical protein
LHGEVSDNSVDKNDDNDSNDFENEKLTSSPPSSSLRKNDGVNNKNNNNNKTWREKHVMRFTGWNVANPDNGLPPSFTSPASPSTSSSTSSTVLSKTPQATFMSASLQRMLGTSFDDAAAVNNNNNDNTNDNSELSLRNNSGQSSDAISLVILDSTRKSLQAAHDQSVIEKNQNSINVTISNNALSSNV